MGSRPTVRYRGSGSVGTGSHFELAEEFLEAHSRRGCEFEPIGVAQGWSPASYAKAVGHLQKLGYERIALGGLVPLKSHEILAVLDGVSRVRHPETKLHLFGVTRCEMLAEFRYFGVTSFDSTSPFRQAFKDDRDNYYVRDGAFVALRVPQVEGNAKLQARIRAGQVNQELARKLEQGALAALRAFDREENDVDAALSALLAYEGIHDSERDRSERYRETLAARPWKDCDCSVCTDIGIEVVLFRGTERNKRRGFHNLHVFSQRLKRARRRSPRRSLVAA